VGSWEDGSEFGSCCVSPIRRKGLIGRLPANRFPVEHSASEIVVKGKKDPFLYNPRLQVIGPGKVSSKSGRL
jgi:hypothetical protein